MTLCYFMSLKNFCDIMILSSHINQVWHIMRYQTLLAVFYTVANAGASSIEQPANATDVLIPTLSIYKYINLFIRGLSTRKFWADIPAKQFKQNSTGLNYTYVDKYGFNDLKYWDSELILHGPVRRVHPGEISGEENCYRPTRNSHWRNFFNKTQSAKTPWWSKNSIDARYCFPPKDSQSYPGLRLVITEGAVCNGQFVPRREPRFYDFPNNPHWVLSCYQGFSWVPGIMDSSVAEGVLFYGSPLYAGLTIPLVGEGSGHLIRHFSGSSLEGVHLISTDSSHCKIFVQEVQISAHAFNGAGTIIASKTAVPGICSVLGWGTASGEPALSILHLSDDDYGSQYYKVRGLTLLRSILRNFHLAHDRENMRHWDTVAATWRLLGYRVVVLDIESLLTSKSPIRSVDGTPLLKKGQFFRKGVFRALRILVERGLVPVLTVFQRPLGENKIFNRVIRMGATTITLISVTEVPSMPFQLVVAHIMQGAFSYPFRPRLRTAELVGQYDDFTPPYVYPMLAAVFDQMVDVSQISNTISHLWDIMAPLVPTKRELKLPPKPEDMLFIVGEERIDILHKNAENLGSATVLSWPDGGYTLMNKMYSYLKPKLPPESDFKIRYPLIEDYEEGYYPVMGIWPSDQDHWEQSHYILTPR